MKNSVKLAMVNTDKIMLSGAEIGLLDVQSTIQRELSQKELMLYTTAINKVNQGKKLNRKDLQVLNRIDQITMDVHGIYLKDAQVTKARIKGANRYGMQFIDRDGLEDHMNMVSGLTNQSYEGDTELVQIIECLSENLCIDCIDKIRVVAFKVANQILLTEEDVWIVQEVSSIVYEELGFSFIGTTLEEALIEACERSDIQFNCHAEIDFDSPMRPNTSHYH